MNHCPSSQNHDLRKLGTVVHKEDPLIAIRADRYLAQRFPFLSRTHWQKKCLDGRVHNHHGPIKPTYKIQPGDQLFHDYPQNLEPAVNHNVFCIFHNHPIMATYKPPHLPMHEGGLYRKNTFYEICRNKWGAPWRAVHRLDRETSGVVVCAKTSTMRSTLAHAFRHHGTTKIYYAIAIGQPPASSWSINQPIGYASKTSWRVKRWIDPAGKPAVTHFQIISTYKNFVWLKIRPVHGRTHQIRIHAAYAGLPLMGDVRYHHDEEIFLRFLAEGYSARVLQHIIVPRLCLHAGTIEFQLSNSNHRRHSQRNLSPLSQKIHIHAPIPYDLQWIWKVFIRHKNPQQTSAEYLKLQSSLHAAYHHNYGIRLPKTLAHQDHPISQKIKTPYHRP